MRSTIAVFIILAACGGGRRPQPVSAGGEVAVAQRIPGGARAPVASLVETLGALRDEAGAPRLLAQGVFEHCGQACACLDFSEPGDPEARFGMCSDVWKDQAAAGGYDWRAMYIAGAYLADQHAAADASGKASLEAAMAALRIPIEPTAASLGVAPPAAEEVAGYSGARHLLTIDASGGVRGGDVAFSRFTPAGAVLVPAELKPLADAGALAAFLGMVADAEPPPVKAAGDGPLDDEAGTPAALDEGKMGRYRMVRPEDEAFATRTTGATHSAIGTRGVVRADALLIVADGAAPGAKLVEVMALAARSGIAVAQGDQLWAIAVTFRGAKPVRPPGSGSLGYGRVGGVGPGVAELVIEVGDRPFLVGDTAVVGRDVVLSVRDEARVAHVVAAIDAALAARASQLAVESWYERPSLGTGRKATVPEVRIGTPATGDLDKAIIRRYIRREIPRITYCYEKRLVDQPGLGGTVTAKFVIAPSGAVSTAEASGVDAEVASCVAAVIKTIEFPKPKGGGAVNVSYPFTFRSTD